MDNLVTLALVGTGQTPAKEIETGTPIDALSAQLSIDLERKLLLTAGARAVYQQAGKMIAAAPTAPAPATADKGFRACSATVIQCLEKLFLNKDEKLIILALERLQKVNMLLPHDLLPRTLEFGVQLKAYRAPLAAVIGERGRWLSQLNPSWSWVSQFLSDTSDELPADAETIWQEGTSGQRTEILRRLRAINPAQAREWLNDVWKKEKAETRTEFIASFEIGLSQEDESFLEQALSDRSAYVCDNAASLLIRLPNSALAQRMKERATAILDYVQGKIVVTLPKKLDAQWERDGLPNPVPNTKKKTEQHSQKARILEQLLPLVSLKHWEQRFAATPEQLIEALKEIDWEAEVLTSWSKAAIHFCETSWALLLMNRLYAKWGHYNRNYTVEHIDEALFALLPRQEAEQEILASFEEGKERELRSAALCEALPTPWSKEFSKVLLQKLRSITSTSQTNDPYDYRANPLQIAAHAIPPSCFEDALQIWILPENSGHYWRTSWEREINRFQDMVATRKSILEEIQ